MEGWLKAMVAICGFCAVYGSNPHDPAVILGMAMILAAFVAGGNKE